jgi:Zn-dependent peptidase ImmA (M78 family)
VNHQRFSGAHEIGHIVLGHEILSFMDDRHRRRESQYENQANHFAAELLMPKIYLQQQGSLSVEKIVLQCRVSEEAARIRMEQLGWE